MSHYTSVRRERAATSPAVLYWGNTEPPRCRHHIPSQFLKVLFFRMQLGCLSHYSVYSRGSATEGLLFDSLQGKGIYLLWNRPWRILEPTQSLPQWILGVLSSGGKGGLKRPQHEADYLPVYGTKVKNAWNYTCTVLYCPVSFYVLILFSCYSRLEFSDTLQEKTAWNK